MTTGRTKTVPGHVEIARSFPDNMEDYTMERRRPVVAGFVRRVLDPVERSEA